MWPVLQFPADLVTLNEKILNGKLHFFVQCQEKCAKCKSKNYSARAYDKCDKIIILEHRKNCFRDFHTTALIWKFLKQTLSLFKHSNLHDYFNFCWLTFVGLMIFNLRVYTVAFSLIRFMLAEKFLKHRYHVCCKNLYLNH